MSDIGAKIELKGEKEYRAQMKSIQQEAKTLSAEMQAVTAEFDKNTSAEERNAKKKEVLTRQIENQQRRVDLLADALSRAEQNENTSADTVNKYKEQLYKAQAVLSDMNAELENNEEAADVAADGMEDVSESTEEAAESGSLFADVFSAEVLSKAILDGIHSLADAAAGVAKGLKDSWQNSVDWADDIATLSTNTGIATDKLQAFEYMAGLVDTDVNTITSSIRKMTSKMASAAGGNKTASEAFEKLGVKTKDASGKLRKADDVFLDVIDALGNLEDGTERDVQAMEIFGKGAQDLNSLIAAGSEGINKYTQEAEEMGYILDEDTIGALTRVKDAQDRFANALDAMERKGAAAFAPVVSTIAEDVLPAISSIADQLGDLLSGDVSFESFVSSITASFEGNKKEIANAVGEGINAAFEGAKTIIDNLPGILDTAADIVNQICEAIDGAENGKALGESLGKLVTAAAGAVEKLSGPVSEVATSLVSALVVEMAKPSYGLKLAGAILKALGSSILGALSGFDEAMSNAFSSIAPEITNEQIRSLLDAGHSVETIASQYGISAQRIYDAANEIEEANEIIAASSPEQNEPAPKKEAAAAASEYTAEYYASMLENAPTIEAAAEEIATQASKPFEDLEAQKWGSDLIKGMAQGIRDAYDELEQAVEGAADIIYRHLHFSRPDEGVLHSYEEWMPDFIKGMAKGIDENKYILENAISSMAEGMTVEMTAGGARAIGGGNTVNVYTQEMTEAQVDYLIDRVNGGLLQ